MTEKTKLSPRAKYLQAQFHLTELMWQAIWDFQKGLCAGCKKPMKKPNTDHRHSDGLIRGILCWKCNKNLGRMGDDPLELLKNFVEYLTHPPAIAALGQQIYGLPGRVGTKKARKLAKKYKKRQEALKKFLT